MGRIGRPQQRTAEVAFDPAESARAAGLRYVTDARPGIRRTRSGTGFRYLDAEGRLVRDRATLARIRSLAIPPAWTDVWICPLANGHFQASGRDTRGRMQYRYHPQWRAFRDETKYGRMLDFCAALARIRQRVERDLALPGLPREKVLAAIVLLLETTLIRVGNEEYARQNRSFGLTTMRDDHVKIDGATLQFRFRGKSRRQHEVALDDRRLARIVKRCQDLPGQELFQYVDDEGDRRSVDSADVNDYLRETSGGTFTAKDFRTWAGTVLAAMALQEIGEFQTASEAKRNVVRAVKRVATQLGNTPAVCRKSYIHPLVVESYMDGAMLQTPKRRAEAAITERISALRPEEAAVLGLLQQRLAPELERKIA